MFLTFYFYDYRTVLRKKGTADLYADFIFSQRIKAIRV